MTSVLTDISLEQRARATLGVSNRAIYTMVASLVRRLHGGGGRLYDIGCGAARFREFASSLCDSYCGVDAIRYDSFPREVECIKADLDGARWPLDDEVADVVVSIETIEHLENPRACF